VGAKFFINAQNITEKVIKEFTMRIFAFDNDGVPTKVDISVYNDFTCRLNYSSPLKAGARTSSNSYWQLYGEYKDMKQFVVFVEEVEFYDGTTWENPQNSILYSQYDEKILEAGDENVLSRG